jgi:hypothetical protein
MLEQWAYRRLYRSNAARDRALQPWVHRYNHHRAHTALGGRPPVSRVNLPPVTTPRSPLSGILMPVFDPQLDRIRRPFNAAFYRLCSATTEAEQEDEVSNLLCHLYRLGELGKRRLGAESFYKMLGGSDDLRAARAAMWARKFDTHDVVVVALPADMDGPGYGALYGASAWKPLASLPQQTDKYGRHVDYVDVLEYRPVVDTIRRAFDAMSVLLPEVRAFGRQRRGVQPSELQAPSVPVNGTGEPL